MLGRLWYLIKGPDLEAAGIGAVGHRVVQGGSRFVQPTVIDDAVIRTVEEISHTLRAVLCEFDYR